MPETTCGNLSSWLKLRAILEQVSIDGMFAVIYE